MSENLRYPNLHGIRLEDKVYVSFVIDTDGKITNVKIERGEYPALNEEATRVVREIPKMIPASQNGRKVPMRMTIPVNFKTSY